MTIWAIVPVKPLRLGKSRLAHVLSEDERARLNRIFLEHTLSVLKEVEEVGQTLVVSRDPAALAIAREYGMRTILEDGAQQLNAALQRAATMANAYSARGVLILPADIPMVTPMDISRFVTQARRHPSVTIAPDRRHDGTNALFMLPPGQFAFSYGPGSFERHCALAREANATLEVVESENLGLDLDLPEDLELYRRIARPESTPE